MRNFLHNNISFPLSQIRPLGFHTLCQEFFSQVLIYWTLLEFSLLLRTSKYSKKLVATPTSYYYRSKNKNRNTELQRNELVNNSYRFYWDFWMLLILIANMIILPVAISFFQDDEEDPHGIGGSELSWIFIFNIISDVIFVLDIVINFRTGT